MVGEVVGPIVAVPRVIEALVCALVTGARAHAELSIEGVQGELAHMESSGDVKDAATELLQGIWTEIQTIHQSMHRRFDQTDARLDRMETCQGGVDARMQGVETRMEGVETRLEGVETHLVLVDDSLRELVSQQLELTRFVKIAVERHGAAIEALQARDHTPPSMS